MKRITFDQDTENWLIAFFNGELDEEEALKVGEWVESSEENREAYEALMRDYLQVRWVQESINIREERARKIIFSSLKKKRSAWLYYGVAASVAVLLSVAVFFLVRDEERVVPVKTGIAKVEPVRTRATLILSTGEQVLLTEANREIQEQNGYTLKIDSTSGVRYDSLAGEQKTERMYNKIVVPRGGEYFLTLSDGTKVWLDADSELEYPVAFSGDSREVKLKGEAYFSVTKNETRSFVVKVDEYTLRVYGTEFNVNAYDVREIQTVLVKGAIGVRANVSAPERMMKPNELAVANVETGQCEIREVDIYPYIAWRSQDIVFENERLESIMEKVARWYDVTVSFQNEALKDLRFDCNMRRYADIEELFFFMEKTSDARFVLHGRTLVVSEKNK